jgi:hypothetical protein
MNCLHGESTQWKGGMIIASFVCDSLQKVQSYSSYKRCRARTARQISRAVQRLRIHTASQFP